MRKSILFLLVLAFGLLNESIGQFVPVWTGNGFNQMNIYVSAATIDDLDMEAGDKIGVFDGENCVGVSALEGPIVEFLAIIASADDDAGDGLTNGFAAGNTISFKIYDASYDRIIDTDKITTTIIAGDAVFTELGSVTVQLEAIGNNDPIANAGSDLLVKEGDKVELNGSGSSDPDGDDLQYFWKAPTGVIIENSTSATALLVAPEVTGTVAANPSDEYKLVLFVDDGYVRKTDTINVTVQNINKPPYFTTQPLTQVQQGEEYSIRVTAIDPDQNVLTFSLGDKTAEWLNLVTVDTKKYLQGTPLNGNVGDAEVELIVTDGTSKDTLAFTINVVNKNDLPKFTSTPVYEINQDAAYEYSVTVSDPDAGDIVYVSATSIPDWLSFNKTSLVLSGTPTKTDIGNHAVQLAVTDSVITDPVYQNFTVKVVNVNDAPVFTSTAVSVGNEDEVYVYAIKVKDYDPAAVLTITCPTKPDWLEFSVKDNVSAYLTGTPGDAAVGASNSVELVVTDELEASTSQNFTIDVTGINDIPYFKSKPVTTAIKDNTYTYSVKVEDADNNADITISDVNIPSWLSLTETANGEATLTGTPGESNLGLNTVVLEATDGIIENPILQSFSINVANSNTAPVFTSTPLTTAKEGSQYLYNVAAQDDDPGTTLSFDAVTLPDWLTFEDLGAGNAILVGIPADADVDGDNNVVISVTDGVITTPVEQEFTISVEDVNGPPVFLTLELDEATEGAAFKDTIVISDGDNTTVKAFFASGLDWLEMQDMTQDTSEIALTDGEGNIIISGTPTPTSVGFSFIAIGLFDGQYTRYKRYLVAVNDVNTAPVAKDMNLNIKEDRPFFMALKGSDIDDPFDITYSIKSGEEPANGELTEVGGNIYVYQPFKDFNGSDEFTYIVSDGELSDDGVVNITIQPVNDPPVLTIEDQYLSTDMNTPVEISAEVLDSRDDPQSPSELIVLYGPFKGDISGNVEDGTFTYTPDADFSGSDLIMVAGKETAGDELISLPKAIFIEVERTNTAPVTTKRTVRTLEDQSISFRLSGFDLETDIADLLFQIVETPMHSSSFTVNHNVVSYTPEMNYEGNDTVFYQVVDEGQLVSEVDTVVIEVIGRNDSPVAGDATIVAESGSTVISFTNLISDEEDLQSELEVEFMFVNEDETARGIFASTIIPTGNPLEYEYTPSHASTFDYILYRVWDTDSLISDVGTIKIEGINSTKATKASDNDPIVSAGDTIWLDWGEEVNFNIVAADVAEPYSAIQFSLLEEKGSGKSNVSGGSTSHDDGSPVSTYDATYKANNSNKDGLTDVIFDKLKISITDDNGNVAIDSVVFAIRVKDEVPPQVDAIADFEINEGTTYDLPISFVDVDTPMDELTFKVTSEGLSASSYTLEAVDTLNKTLSITPPADYYGNTVFRIRVSDSDDLYDEKEFQFTVNNVNDAPVLYGWENEPTADEGNDITVAVYAEDGGGEDDDLTFTASGIPAESVDEIVFNENVMTITPAEGVDGTLSIEVIVSDGQAEAKDTFNIVLNSANDAPELAEIEEQSINEDQSFSITLTPVDNNGDDVNVEVTVSNEALIEEVTVTPADGASNVNRTLTITPNNNLTGSTNVTVVSSDGSETSINQFVLNVNPVNDPPVLSITQTETVEEDNATYLVLNADDVDSYNLTFSAGSNNENVLVEVVDNLLLIGAANNYNGSASVEVTVEDEEGATDSKVVAVTVTAVNDIPEFTSEPVTTVVAGNAYTYTVTATDVDGDDVSFAATTKPEWLSITDNGNGTATLSGTPSTADIGNANVSISLTDGVMDGEVVQQYAVSVTGESSNVETIETNAFAELYPNPTAGQLHIEIKGDYLRTVSIKLFDINGANRLMEEHEVYGPEFVKNLNIAKLPAGVYQLQIVTNEGTFNQKIVKR